MAYINKEQTAQARKIVNEIGKKYGFKFSTSMSNNSTLNIMLMSGRKLTLEDLELENFISKYISKYGLNSNENEFIKNFDEFIGGLDDWQKREYYYKYSRIKELLNDGKANHTHFLTGELEKMFNEIETEVKKALGWYDNSESQIDYFDTAFYFNMEIGKWNKPYEVKDIPVAKENKTPVAKEDTKKLVKEIKENSEDYEFYPTTDEIINKIIDDFKFIKQTAYNKINTILDIGAGDGRVLNTIGKAFGLKKLGIEKSTILKDKWQKDIIPIGADFNEITLIDKEADLIFCNPPYKEYVQWTSKILEEGNFRYLYLVIPSRWKENKQIMQILEDRKLKFNIVGEYDFLDAERKARAYVDLISVKKEHTSIDSFTYFYTKHFEQKEEIEENKEENETIEDVKNDIVSGADFIQRLVKIYDAELNKIVSGISLLATVDASVMELLDIDKAKIISTLEYHTRQLKKKYWHLLFERLDKITNRLTAKSRECIMRQMQENILVDFNTSNIYDIVVWVIKNANDYIDKQYKDVYLSLFDDKNITNYKSNQKVYSDSWRYEKKDSFKAILDYRIVLSGWSAIYDGGFSSYDYDNNLHKSAHTKINDLITIANNLGFSIIGNSYSLGEWQSGKKKFLYFASNQKLDIRTKTNVGKIEEVYYHKEDNYYQYRVGNIWYHENNIKPIDGIFMEIKAFKNGNIHIRFSQKFIKAYNIKVALLFGWVKNKKEFEYETGITITKEEKKYFNTNKAINLNNSAALLGV